MKINLLGTFNNLDEVWQKYPEGGREGDYITVGGIDIEWNKYTNNWGDEGSESSTTRPTTTYDGDVNVNGDLRIGGRLISDTLNNYATKEALNDVKEIVKSDEELLLFLEENGYKPNSDNDGDSGSEDSGGEGDSSTESIDIMGGVNVDNNTIVKKDNGNGDVVLQINTDNPTRYVPVDGVTIVYDSENGYFKAIGGSSGEGEGEGSGEGGGGGITTEQLTSILSSYAKKTDALKNPYALTWSGNSSGSYDGSSTANIKIPTTLPASDVSAWAKASKKPTYTASEVGALSEDGGTIDGDLTVTGNFKASHITSLSTSDERLKKNIRPFSALEILASMGGVWQYEYQPGEVARDAKNAGTHIGFIYQNVEKSLMSGMCEKRKDEYGALNYHHSDYLALLAACNLELAKRVEMLEEMLNERKA